MKEKKQRGAFAAFDGESSVSSAWYDFFYIHIIDTLSNMRWCYTCECLCMCNFSMAISATSVMQSVLSMLIYAKSIVIIVCHRNNTSICMKHEHLVHSILWLVTNHSETFLFRWNSAFHSFSLLWQFIYEIGRTTSPPQKRGKQVRLGRWLRWYLS